MNSLNLALSLAEMDFRVFPLRVNGKIPAVTQWNHAASADPIDIAELWADMPEDANVGIFTGALGSGQTIMVLDVDVKDGKPGLASLERLCKQHTALPETFTVQTASGGLHYYFLTTNSVANSTGKLGEGLDVRGMGGYVVAPGSEIDGHAYIVTNDTSIAQAPEWLEKLAGAMIERDKPSLKPLVEPDQTSAIERAISYLISTAPEAIEGHGGDAATFKIAARLKDMGISEDKAWDLMLDHWNQHKAIPSWDPEELKVKVENAYRYGKSPLGSATAQAVFADNFNSVEVGGTADKPLSIKFEWFKNIKPRDRSRYLINKVIDQKAFSMIYGDSNSGKTFVALSMAYAITSGRTWDTHKTEPGTAVYLALEGNDGIRDRFMALRQEASNLDIPFALISQNIRFVGDKPEIPGLVQTLKQIQSESKDPLRLIVIDTLACALGGGDENSSVDMGAFIGVCNQLRSLFGCHVMVIHHTGKKVSSGARGHSALRAAVDTEIMVYRHKKDRVIKFTKQRDMRVLPAKRFKLSDVDIGQDQDGEQLTSCVVTLMGPFYEDNEEESFPDLSAQCQSVLEEINTLARNEESISIHLDQLLDHLDQVQVSKNKQKCIRIKLYREWTNNLISLGYLIQDGEHVKLTQKGLFGDS